MKVNLVKNQNHKLFKYNLLKLQIYSNQSSFDVFTFSNETLEYIEAYLKQVLKIIFEYHVCQFKILFIGFPVISKMKQIGWQYSTELEDGIEKTYSWFLDNIHSIKKIKL